MKVDGQRRGTSMPLAEDQSNFRLIPGPMGGPLVVGPTNEDVLSTLQQARIVLRQALALALGSTALAAAAVGLAAVVMIAFPYWLAFEAALVVALFAAWASRPWSKRTRELKEQFPNDQRVQQASPPRRMLEAVLIVAAADCMPILYFLVTFAA